MSPVNPTNPTPGAARVVRNVAYGSDARNRVDLHVPAGEGFTTLLFVSGGGWTAGSRHWITGVAEHLVAQGIAVARVDHRLLPSATYGDLIADVRAAYTWLAGEIGGYGGNAERLVVGGHSAGGHLAAMVPSGHRDAPAPIGVIGLAAAMDPRQRMPAELCPSAHVSVSTPPHLLLVAENDLPMVRPMNDTMDALLRGARVAVRYETIPATDHFDVVASPVALDTIAAWITALP